MTTSAIDLSKTAAKLVLVSSLAKIVEHVSSVREALSSASNASQTTDVIGEIFRIVSGVNVLNLGGSTIL